MRIASIDIGTNTILLLIADVGEDGTIHPVAHEQRLPRLGKDVDQRRMISIGAFDKIAWIINEYKNLAKQHKAERIVAAATSAVRDAANREEFCAYVLSATGIGIEVLPGEEEALWTYYGALSGFAASEKESVVLDIGGGSTEISLRMPGSQNGGKNILRYSLQVGSVRITERYLKHSPPSPEEVDSARQMILEEFAPVRNPGFRDYRLIGVAGTVTTLACLDQRLEEFDVEKVSGYTLSVQTVRAWSQRLNSMDTGSIAGLSSTTSGRADILGAGVLILSEIMNHFGFESVIASERGLRYGLAVRDWQRSRR